MGLSDDLRAGVGAPDEVEQGDYSGGREYQPAAADPVFGGYWTGCKLLSQPVRVSFENFDLASAGEMMLQYVLGSLVFGLVVAAVFWVLSMLLLTVFRRDVPRP